MATAEQYADWIVKNKDKKGTPEFDTVAKAYRAARQQPQGQPTEQPETPKYGGLTGLMTGEDVSIGDIGRSAVRQAGLTGRALLEGAGGLVDFLATPIHAASQYLGGPDLRGGGQAIADVSGLPTPETPTERITSQGTQMLGAGVPVLGAAQKMAQGSQLAATLAANPGSQLASMVGSGAAGGTAKEAGAGPAGEFIATLAGGLTAPAALAKIKPMATAKNFIGRMREYGYKVPPAMAKRTAGQQFVEGVAGPVPTKQAASLHNQKITNSVIKRELGYPDDLPLNKEGLNFVRQEAGKVYIQAKKAGDITLDSAFKKDLSKIASQGSALAREIPELKQADVINLVKAFSKKRLSSEAIVDAIKQLRADASTGFRSADPAITAKARASGKIADALERVLERQLKISNPSLVPDLKAARQLIAKTYTIENALKGESVDAVALGRQLSKGKPLSGAIRDVAEFGQKFKGAAQVEVPQQTNFRPMDMVAGIGGAAATQNPSYLAVMFARPLLRKTILSSPYQNMLAKVKPEQVDAIMQMPPATQAKALDDLLQSLQQEEELISQ